MNRRSFLASSSAAALIVAFPPLPVRAWASGTGDARPSGYAPSIDYPSDSYIRPDVDYLPVFETLCGVSPSTGVLERDREFAQHRLELIQRNDKTVTEWEWTGRPNIVPPAILQISEKLSRVPASIAVTVENRGDSRIEMACRLTEISWWTDPARVAQDAVAVGVPALSPGEANQVEFKFDASRLKQPLAVTLFIRDSESTRHSKLVLSELQVHYAPSNSIQNPELEVAPSAAANSTVVFKVSGTEVNPSNVIDIQCEEGRWTLWRVRLTAMEKAALAAQGSVEVKRQVPWFLPARKLSAVLVADGGRFPNTTRPFEVTNTITSDLPQMTKIFKS